MRLSIEGIWRSCLLLAVAFAADFALPAVAQEHAAPPTEKQKPAAPLVSVDARDADLRETLTALFKQAEVANYAIAPNVQGTVTLRLKDQPLDNALNVLARTASPRFSWSKTDGIYEVKRRATRRTSSEPEAASPTTEEESLGLGDGTRVEVIRLMYADARDIAAVLGAIRPEGLRAAVAYDPLNRVVTQWGGSADSGFVNGAIGGFPRRGGSNFFGLRPPGNDVLTPPGLGTNGPGVGPPPGINRPGGNGE